MRAVGRDSSHATTSGSCHNRVLFPANFPAGVPGGGTAVMRTSEGIEVAVLNLMGRVFMLAIDDPFALATR